MPEHHSPNTILVTGGAGFIGSNFIRQTLTNHPHVHIVNVDALTYAGSLANLKDIPDDRHTFIHADIRDKEAMRKAFLDHYPDTVVNFAAHTHVDRSINSPLAFVETNVLGTAVLLETACAVWKNSPGKRFHHISTDEVYGSLGPSGQFRETDPADPSSPYSASKAGADLLARAWHRTFGLDVTISNCSNNYGPRQFPEKLIPLMILKALAEEPLPVYGKGANVRDWLHVDDHGTAVWAILTRGESGRTYNIGGNNEWTNIDLVRLLCRTLDDVRPRSEGKRYEDLITFVADRPGHDLRYAVDIGRIADELGWQPAVTFEDGLNQTIHWYLDNEKWLAEIRSEKYAGERLGLYLKRSGFGKS